MKYYYKLPIEKGYNSNEQIFIANKPKHRWTDNTAITWIYSIGQYTASLKDFEILLTPGNLQRLRKTTKEEAFIKAL